MIFVIDSSVAVKWFLAEPDHAHAVALSKLADELHAPEFVIVEVTNVAWKEAIRKNITAEQAHGIATQIVRSPVHFVPISTLHEQALKIALAVNHSVYDCLYLACAEQIGAYLITADKSLSNKTRSTTYANFVRVLGEQGLEKPESPIAMHLSVLKLRSIIDAAEAFRLAQENVLRSLALPPSKAWARAKASALAYDSPGFYKLRRHFQSLSENELIDVLALEHIGEFGPANWSDARSLCERLLSSKEREGHIRVSLHRTRFLRNGATSLGFEV